MNRCWPVLLACVALAGCGSLFQTKAAPPTMYLLSMTGKTPPEKALPGPAARPIDLVVLKPHVRGGLDTDRIALLYPDRRLDYFAKARWSGPVDELMQELAVQEFRTLDAVRNVSGDASVFAASYWLEIEVVDFQAEYAAAVTAPTVHVRLLARIGNSTDRRVLAKFETDSREPAVGNHLSAIVDAYNHASDKALATIVADCIGTLEGR